METMELDDPLYSTEQRLVHFDLKGAPPIVSYYEKLFPLLAKWGVTGLLMEYEDMFPYWGEYQDIACKSAYSVVEIQRILQLAKLNNLVVIPLVQTFGHMEFVLKHQKFHHLREIKDFPMALCPLEEDSLKLVAGMVDQVLQLHPGCKWFHIGADEVYHIGHCPRCHQHMQTTSMTRGSMFFRHAQRVLETVQQRAPGMRCIMWDDMYREADLDSLRASGITSLVEPMVWSYRKSSLHLPEDLWTRYSSVFPSVWVASAFKGATGPCAYVTDAGFHVDNHKLWLRAIKDEIRPKFALFSGMCITGWQRYDHYSMLCELFPASLPSLAVCLLAVKEGSFTKEAHEQASKDLNFSELIPLNPYKNAGVTSQCNFPGSGVYVGIQILLGLKVEYKKILKNERMNGWMSPYNVKCRFANPAHIKHFLPHAEDLLQSFHSLLVSLRPELEQTFPGDTVSEWVLCNLTPNIDKLTEIVTQGRQLMAVGAAPRDEGGLVGGEGWILGGQGELVGEVTVEDGSGDGI